jgi:hypothetical protein
MPSLSHTHRFKPFGVSVRCTPIKSGLKFLWIEQTVLEATQGHIWQHDSFSFAVFEQSDIQGHKSGAEYVAAKM